MHNAPATKRHALVVMVMEQTSKSVVLIGIFFGAHIILCPVLNYIGVLTLSVLSIKSLSPQTEGTFRRMLIVRNNGDGDLLQAFPDCFFLSSGNGA